MHHTTAFIIAYCQQTIADLGLDMTGGPSALRDTDGPGADLAGALGFGSATRAIAPHDESVNDAVGVFPDAILTSAPATCTS